MGRIRDGCEDSLDRLLRRYWPRLVEYSAHIVGSRDSAADVVQECFIRVWTRREEWTPAGSVSGYLYRITRNLALNARRDLRGRRERRDRASKNAPAGRPRGPLQDLYAESVRRAVEAALESLPPRRREVFVLSRFHGLSHAEIAEAMGISTQTVSNQMTSALRELRRTLSHLVEES